jgi:DNA-binding phage protein
MDMTKNPTPQSLSPVLIRLRERAKKQGITAYALAQLTGHSISTCQRTLDGEVSPSLATVEAVAKALGMRVALQTMKKKPQP